MITETDNSLKVRMACEYCHKIDYLTIGMHPSQILYQSISSAQLSTGLLHAATHGDIETIFLIFSILCLPGGG